MSLAVAGCMSSVVAQQLPVITIEPVPQRVIAGHELLLTVSATAGPHTPQIQWYHDGVAISGKTDSALHIPNMRKQQEGLYKALASMPDGAAWSREVFVRVDASPPSPGLLDTGFYTPGIEVHDAEDGDSIDAVLVLPDGRVAIGGEFRIRNSDIRNLAILKPNGLPDLRFAPDIPGGRILALTLSQGRLVAAGQFGSVNGTPCGGIAALDTVDGKLSPDWDHSLGFAPGGEFPPRIHTLCATGDGGVLAGGTFTFWRTAGGVTQRPLLVRLLASGEPDESFALSPVSGGEVRSIRLTSAGDIAVVGGFTSPTERFAVLGASGLPAPGFSLPDSPDARVRDVLPLPDGSFLIGGDFSDITGRGLAHFFADGSVDLNFDVGTDDDVNTLALDDEGRIVLGGDFSILGDVPHLFIGRLNADLTLDTSFRTDGLDEEVSSIAISGSGLLASGDFAKPHPLIVRLFSDFDHPVGTTEVLRTPTSQAAFIDGPLDLSVTASPARPGRQYRWTKDGAFLADTFVPSLAIDRITTGNAGIYQVQITDSAGTVTVPPVRVRATHALPGHEREFRYRGGATTLPPGETTTAIKVPDQFRLENVRVSVDITHPNTDFLVIELESPGDDRITLFDDNIAGRDLRATTFDDHAGDLKIKEAVPPFTGTYQPYNRLDPLVGDLSQGTWKLIVTNRSGTAQLLDWTLQLRAEAEPVNYDNYVQAIGAADNAATRNAYSMAQGVIKKPAGLVPHELTASGFRCSHWRWTAPPDASYTYELLVPDGWVDVAPSKVFVTRFPGKREFHEVHFPLGRTRAYYRLRTNSPQ